MAGLQSSPRAIPAALPLQAYAPPGSLTVSGGWRQAFSSLENRHFRIFWIGMLFSFVGMQMGQVARQWLVYELTGSSTMLGIVGSATAIPMLILSLPGGVVADRVVKRNLLMWTQGLTGCLAFLIAFLLTMEWLQPWHVILASVASGAVMSFNMPGRQALVAELVPPEQFMNAIALNSAGMNLTRIIAPTVTGLLVAGVGMASTYFVYSFQYVIVIAFLLMLPATLAAREHMGTISEDFTDALSYVRQKPAVLGLLILATVPAVFAMPYQMLLPVFIKDVYHLGPEALGAMMGAIGAGALVGSLLVAFLGNFRQKGLLMLLSAMAFGICLIFFAQSQSYGLSLALAALLGGVSMVFMALNNTLIHLAITDEMRGRVMGLFMMSWGLMPLGTLPAGVLGDIIGVPLVVSIGGVIMALVSLAALLFLPILRRLE